MKTSEIKKTFEKGPALVLENDLCQGEYLYADDLKKMIGSASLDFVFMATCHSEIAVNIFFDAGAKHVIGIKHDETIEDAAILTFTKTFYSMVWKPKSNVCNCF